MITDRYNNDDVIKLRKCHLYKAMQSMKFRNDKGVYYWHGDDLRLTEPKWIELI